MRWDFLLDVLGTLMANPRREKRQEVEDGPDVAPGKGDKF